MFFRVLISVTLLFLISSCSASPESRLKSIDFDKIQIAVDESDPEKSKKLLSDEFEDIGKLCESLKVAKIEMKHLEAVDIFERLEFMMALGGFSRISEMLKNGTIRNISDKDKEEIKYICQKLAADAEKAIKK